MPNAARISDYHTCPMVNPGPVPHVGGPVSSGSPNVNVGYLPAARVSDSAVCVPAIDSISRGSANVFINGLQAARVGDPTVHGGVIVAGCPTVNIGESPQVSALKNAAKTGAPFCEECERLKRKNEELRSPPPPNEPPREAASLADVLAPRSADAKAVADLARETNDGPADPLREVRRRAREKVAYDFFSEAAVAPSRVEASVRSFDLHKPLRVIAGADGAVLVGTSLDGSKLVSSKIG